jgi:SAM-dependent methyltransferase
MPDMLASTEISGKDRLASTEEYYETFPEQYFELTVHADLSALYDRFLRYVPLGSRILDVGSGSGRDTLAFLRRGYEVEAFDSSPALCALSTQLTGVRTRTLKVQDLEDKLAYDGIWACASLLHVPEGELPDAMARLTRALKPGGALYMSFKHGPGERVAANGRFYTDMDRPRLRRLLRGMPEMALEEIWNTEGESTFKGRDKWLNAIALKQGKSETP